MNTIIADNLRTEQTVSTRIDLFFKQIGLSKLLKKSNFYKESGIPCAEILKTLFTLVFADKNLYRMLDTNPEQIGFKKNTAYRFLNSMRYNWSRLLALTAANVINAVNPATSEDRANVLIIDDSFYDRNRSKKVELLARVFDHSMHKYVKGFKMLTLGWSDGNTFIPVSFSLLSSAKESNVLCPANQSVDKRTIAYQQEKPLFPSQPAPCSSFLIQRSIFRQNMYSLTAGLPFQRPSTIFAAETIPSSVWLRTVLRSITAIKDSGWILRNFMLSLKDRR